MNDLNTLRDGRKTGRRTDRVAALPRTSSTLLIFTGLVFSLFWLGPGAAALTAQNPLPTLNSRRLLNDLQVTVARTQNFSDAMAMGLVLRYGSAFDPEDKGGLAYLVSRLLMKATTDRSAADIRAELEALGATIEISCDWDGIRIMLRAPNTAFERALLLLYQIVGEASFEESDFAAVRQELLAELQRPPDPRQRIHKQLEDVLFQETTYGRPLRGTPASVSELTPGDVRYFYRRFFSPNQAALEIVGDIDPALAHPRIARVWGRWVRNDEVPFTFTRPRSLAGREIYVENDASSPAAQFILGGLFPRHDDPDYINARLAARVLQERLNKLLPAALLTVSTEGRRLASPFYIQGQAAAEQAVGQIREIQAAVASMRTAPVTEEELAGARRQMTEEFNRNLANVEGMCQILLDAELYRLGSNYASFFLERVNNARADAVQRAAATWLLAGGEALLIRGPLPVLKTALATLGTIRPMAR